MVEAPVEKKKRRRSERRGRRVRRCLGVPFAPA
jgi:hypothetical protein